MIVKDNLPHQWKLDTIGGVAEEIHTGGTPRRSNDKYWNGDIKWAKAGEISSAGKYISETEEKVTEDASISVYGEDYVFVTIIGANLSSVVLPETEIGINQQNVAVKLCDSVNREYFYYYIQSISNHLQSLGRGGGQQAINQSVLSDINIPVPPLEEQERIVQEIEKRLELVNDTNQKINNLKNLATEYRDSTFAYLLAGLDMSEKQEDISLPDSSVVPDNWNVCELNQIADRLRSTCETESDYNYDLYSFEALDQGANFFVRDGENIKSRKRELFGGEVLISRLNPRISRVCKVSHESDNKQIASTEFVAVELISDEISREFLYQYLKTPLIREYLKNQTTGSTGSHSRVSFDEVMSISVPIPPLEKQKELIEELSEIEHNAQSVKNSVTILDKYSEEYKESVLSEAFSGHI